MKARIVLMLFLAIFLGIYLTGCGGSGGSSDSSAWTSINPTGASSTTASGTMAGTGPATATGTTAVATQTTIAVVSALNVLSNGNSTPINITVTNLSNPEEQPSVAMSSSLGGTFDPATGNTENGKFLTTYTAPASGSGTTNIIALVDGVIGSSAISIVPAEASVYTVSVIPGATTVAQKKAIPVSVKVVDQNGKALEGNVSMVQSLDGSFDPKSDSLSNGYFNTNFIAGSNTGVCTITAFVNGISGHTAVTVLTAAPVAQKTYKLSIIPAKATMTNSTNQTISVKVVDENNSPVSSIKVGMNSSSGGSFDSDYNDTDDNGLAYFIYTAPGTPGNDTITAQALGNNATTTIIIQ